MLSNTYLISFVWRREHCSDCLSEFIFADLLPCATTTVVYLTMPSTISNYIQALALAWPIPNEHVMVNSVYLDHKFEKISIFGFVECHLKSFYITMNFGSCFRNKSQYASGFQVFFYAVIVVGDLINQYLFYILLNKETQQLTWNTNQLFTVLFMVILVNNLNLVTVDIYIFKGGVFTPWSVNKLFDLCNEFPKPPALEITNRGVSIF